MSGSCERGLARPGDGRGEAFGGERATLRARRVSDTWRPSNDRPTPDAPDEMKVPMRFRAHRPIRPAPFRFRVSDAEVRRSRRRHPRVREGRDDASVRTRQHRRVSPPSHLGCPTRRTASDTSSTRTRPLPSPRCLSPSRTCSGWRRRFCNCSPARLRGAATRRCRRGRRPGDPRAPFRARTPIATPSLRDPGRERKGIRRPRLLKPSSDFRSPFGCQKGDASVASEQRAPYLCRAPPRVPRARWPEG